MTKQGTCLRIKFLRFLTRKKIFYKYSSKKTDIISIKIHPKFNVRHKNKTHTHNFLKTIHYYCSVQNLKVI